MAKHFIAKVLVISQLFVQILSYDTYNTIDYFPQFTCNMNQCTIANILSDGEFQDQIQKLSSKKFDYYPQQCAQHYYRDCSRPPMRNTWTSYKEITIEDSELEKLPSGDFSQFNHITSFSASDVGIQEINRDDFKSFKSLSTLDLSNNNITNLGNVVFLHLESLEVLNLSNNSIETIHVNTFDECSKNLILVDLSNNQLKEIHANVFTNIGKSSTNAQLNFAHNQIDTIISTVMINTFETIDISYNLLKKLNLNCTSIDNLLLNDNKLEEFSVDDNCRLKSLDLSNNFITQLKVADISSLILSNNKDLRNLTLNVVNLTVLKVDNVTGSVITFESLKNATKLQILDASNSYIGIPKINTFANKKLLQKLTLRNTGLSNIQHGMFSHQKNLKDLDISANNLSQIDIRMFMGLLNLEKLDISGNKLTIIDHYESILDSFPKLTTIGIEDNNWNCSYLYDLVKKLNVKIKEPKSLIHDSSNVLGIACTTSSEIKIKLLEDKNETLALKLNEIIAQMNEIKAKDSNGKYDSDVIKAELFSLKNEVLEIKSRMILTVANANITSNNFDINEARKMMEELNKFTLEKQKLSQDKLEQRINELQFEMKKNEIANGKNEILRAKNEVPEKPRQETLVASNGNESKGIEIPLTVMLTSLVIIGCIFVYTKLKKLLYQQNNLMSVRARSTNTINTSVELPFND